MHKTTREAFIAQAAAQIAAQLVNVHDDEPDKQAERIYDIAVDMAFTLAEKLDKEWRRRYAGTTFFV